jgi:hypothetical protein
MKGWTRESAGCSLLGEEQEDGQYNSIGVITSEVSFAVATDYAKRFVTLRSSDSTSTFKLLLPLLRAILMYQRLTAHIRLDSAVRVTLKRGFPDPTATPTSKSLIY